MAGNNREIIIESGFNPIKVDIHRSGIIKNGKALLQHIFNVQEIRANGTIHFRASCNASMDISKVYQLSLEVTPDERVFKIGHCTCVAGGEFNCKHGAALVHFINSERPQSCTDGRMEWGSPSERKLKLAPKGVPVNDLLGIKSTPPVKFQYNPDQRYASYAEKMAEFGLTNASFYKSLTCDKRLVLFSLITFLNLLFSVCDSCSALFPYVISN